MRLYLITDDSGRSPEDLAERVAAGIRGGVTAVQFREKSQGPTLAARAYAAVAEQCANSNVPLFLNADLLGRFETDSPPAGIHYSDRNLPLHPNARTDLSGYSAHGVEDAITAFTHDVDFVTLSPVFPTPSKAGILSPIGTNCLRESRKKLPGKTLVALGGIEESNARQCISAGADGIAVIRAILASENPERSASNLRSIIENCQGS